MSSSDTETAVTLTPEALAKVRAVMTEQDLSEDERNLRLFVQGGGCGGPSFGLAFDARQHGDAEFDLGGVTLLIDAVSLPYTHGASIDYVETPEMAGFKVSVPPLEGGCSPDTCGQTPTGCGPSGCG